MHGGMPDIHCLSTLLIMGSTMSLLLKVWIAGFALSTLLAAQTDTVYRIDTFAGGGTPDGELATTASFQDIASLAVDKAGNVYFETGQIILRLDTDGTLTHIAGNGTIGCAGDGGAATQAQLGYQGVVAVDLSGNVYFADWVCGRVRRIFNGIITTIAGGGVQSGDNVPATQAEMIRPQGLAIDLQGDIFVSDTVTEKVRKISNGIITTVGGNGTPGFSGDGGPALDAQFRDPEALAIDSASNLYVVDPGNNRVRRIAGDGTISTVAGSGTIGYNGPTGDNGPATSADLNMYALSGIATDAAGSLYISSNDAIRKVVNGIITTVAGVGPSGSNGNEGDGGPATQGLLSLPTGVAVDASGNLYIGSSGYGSDDARIRKVSQGIITTAAGGGFSIGDGGAAMTAQLSTPDGLALDAAGNLYIADASNDRIRRVSSGIITTVAGTGTSFTGDTGDGGPAVDATFDQPEGVFIDSLGALFISDASEAIRKVANGVVNSIAGQGSERSELDNDEVFGVGTDGSIYTTDLFENVIHKISNGVVTTFAGNGTAGYSGDNGPATMAQLNTPWGLALDAAGNLYIADYGNGAIRKVSNGIISTVASGLGYPQAMAFDAAGNLFVCDAFVVLRISGGIVTTIAGGGPSFGDGGPALLAQFDGLGGIAVDAAGRVFASDTNNNRVRVLTPQQAGCADTTGPGTVTETHTDGAVKRPCARPLAMEASH
jgi:sugar lactone lactonase YvrE